MTQQQTFKEMKIFLIIWFGQVVSLVGSSMTGFALGVWVYQTTGSVTQSALITLLSRLPGILISPIAGALVDRWNRRWAMILSDSGAGLSTAAIAILGATNHLEIWHICVAIALSSTFSAFQWPAYSAATTLLVPPKHLGRASGMSQIGEAVGQLISPMLGSILLVTIKIQGVILLDFTTFGFALVTLLTVRFPDAKPIIAEKTGKSSLLQESAYGWKYITDRPGLFALLILFATTNFMIGMVQVLITPLLLIIADVTTLGFIMSFAGIGMLIGTIVMSSLGGPKRLISGVFCFEGLIGICILVAGSYPDVKLIALSAFLIFFAVPIINGCSQAIWQIKVAPGVQGRVFATRQMIAHSSFPLGYLIAGPLADQVFEPLMAPGGLLAKSVGQIIGVGPGRGIGLIFIIMGASIVLATLVGYQYPRLRLVESELPDAFDELHYNR